MLKVLLKKEILQFRRSKFLLWLMFAFPILVMLVMPWIMQMDVQNIRIAVVDPTDASFTRKVRTAIKASPYFICSDYADHAAAIEAMDADLLDVVVTIPQDFERLLAQGTPDPILIEANGVNSMKGTQGMQYAMQVVAAQLPSSASASSAISLSSPMGDSEGASAPSLQEGQSSPSIFLFNPSQNARLYMTPALMIIVLLLICGFLPALNIVGEKENGTMEQINVMPVSRLTFILSKLIPYWVMGLLIFGITMLLGWLVFGLAPASGLGGLLVIFGGAVLFIMTMSAFSVCVANISDTYQQAIFIMFFFLLCFMLLSGLLTPIASMPKVVQIISTLFPPRYIIDILRGVYLKGASFWMLRMDFLALTVMSFVFAGIAVLTYRKQS